MENSYFSKIIKEERKKHRMTQEELATLSGVSLVTIRATEQGTTIPNLNSLNKILKLFNLELMIKRIDK